MSEGYEVVEDGGDADAPCAEGREGSRGAEGIVEKQEGIALVQLLALESPYVEGAGESESQAEYRVGKKGEEK
jgi:hypothetical protein